MSIQPVELEISRETTAILSQAGQKFAGAGYFLDLENPCSGDLDIAIVALPQFQCLDDSGRETHRQTSAPISRPAC